MVNQEHMQSVDRARIAADPERWQAYGRAYRAANHEHIQEKDRAWRGANWEHQRDRVKAYALANPERLAAKSRAYALANPGKRAESRGRRRASKQGAVVTKADYKAILAEFGMVCHICGLEIETIHDLHYDHVIPLSKGGEHTQRNIRPSHTVCNLRKGSRILAAA